MTPEPTRSAPPADSVTRSAGEPPTATADRTNTFAQPGTLPPVHSIPGYELLAEIARGGMGVVYKARQLRLNREVALKLVLHADPKSLIRFLAEAEAVAAVRHPHVVQVFDSGQHAGRPYLAMELCPNGTLTTKLAAEKMPPRAAAELLAQIADGIGAAHAAGIVHRDLKPGNVLFDADDRPKVADFGLAKRGSGADLTNTQAIMGTPAYMSPEQAGGGTKFVGPQADVWALGVILYQCLTGRRPFDGDSPLEVIDRVRSADPPSVRSVSREVPRELEAVVRKCLAKEPAERYATATELAADLRNWLEGRSLTAKPAGAAEAAVKWVRRNRVLAGVYALTAAVLVLGAFGVGLFGLWRAAEKARAEAAEQKALADTARGDAETARDKEAVARGEAEKQKAEADRQRDKFERFEYGWKMQTAHRHWQEFNLPATVPMLDDTNPKLRGWEWHYLNNQCDNSLLTLRGHTNYVLSADWSANGKLIVSTEGYDAAGNVRLWDAETGRKVRSLKANVMSSRAAAQWSADGKHVVVLERGGTVKFWSAADGSERVVLHGNQQPNSWYDASFSPNGSHVLVGRTEGVPQASIIDTKTGKVTATLAKMSGKEHLWSTGWSPDGKRVVAFEQHSNDMPLSWTPRMWDTATGKELPLPEPLRGKFTGRFSRAEWSPDGKTMLTIGDGSEFRGQLWDVDTSLVLHELPSVAWFDWQPGGRKLLTSSASDNLVRVWDLESGKATTTVNLAPFGTWIVKWNPAGTRFVTVSTDGRRLAVWDAVTGAEVVRLFGHTSVVSTAEWSPDGKRIVTTSNDGTARVWEVESARGQPLRGRGVEGSLILPAATGCEVWDTAAATRLLTLEVPAERVEQVKKSPDGAWLLIGLNGTSVPVVEVWDVKRQKRVHQFPGYAPQSYYQAWDFNSQYFYAIQSEGKSVRVWDVTTGEARLTVEGVPCQRRPTGDGRPGKWHIVTRQVRTDVRPAALFDTAGRFAVPLQSGRDRIWRTDTWEEVPNTGRSSPDGTRLLTLDPDGKVPSALIELKTGRVVRTLDSACIDCWWSPDGKRFVARDGTRSPVICDAATGEDLLTLRGHEALVNGGSWSPDGRYVATTDQSHVTYIWDAQSAERVQALTKGGWVGDWSPGGKRVLLYADIERDTLNMPVRNLIAEIGGEKRVYPLAGGHTVVQTSSVWSPDGKRILTSGGDHSIRVWDANSGAELLVLKEKMQWVEGHWSADGTKIITIGWDDHNKPDRTLNVYDATPKESKPTAKPPGK